MEVLSYSTEVVEWGRDALNPIILDLYSLWRPHGSEVSVTLHFYLAWALCGLAWKLWEQWTEQKSNFSHALFSVGISLLILLTTVLPQFIYSCDDNLSIKLTSALAFLGKVCILSPEEAGAPVQQSCALELVQELCLEVGWSHPVHLADLVLSLCYKGSFPRTGVFCGAVSSCCAHPLFHYWKCIIWHWEKSFQAPVSAWM